MYEAGSFHSRNTCESFKTCTWFFKPTVSAKTFKVQTFKKCIGDILWQIYLIYLMIYLIYLMYKAKKCIRYECSIIILRKQNQLLLSTPWFIIVTKNSYMLEKWPMQDEYAFSWSKTLTLRERKGMQELLIGNISEKK